LLALAYSFLFFNTLLIIAKLKGARVIWTVHNLHSHENKFPKLEAFHFDIFIRMVNAVIAMNPSTLKHLPLKYPRIKNIPVKVIPHGFERSWYPNNVSTANARAALQLQPADKVFLLLGQLRPYKKPEILIHHFKENPQYPYKLIIAGNTKEDYKQKLQTLIGEDNRILLHPTYIADKDVQLYFNAADVVWLPYIELNSGVMLLALSFNKTLLMPYAEDNEDLLNAYPDWIISYTDLNAQTLSNALQRAQQNIHKQADLESRNWNTIANQTIEFYNAVLQKNNSPVTN